jgi:opacity protein-like surface antigen
MIRNFIITLLLGLVLLPAVAQDRVVKREVTLYNPYKPSLNESKKKSFFPDMTDTAKFKPSFRYDVTTDAYMPVYTVSPIKAAVLQPDPLEKLYRSYVNIGLGNNTSPLAEISITNERSKKGAIGFYGRHYSNNGNIKLQNDRRVFAGYMDNDASLFGKKFFKNNVLGASLDVAQRTRHAYGYDTSIVNYAPTKKQTGLAYTNLGTVVSLASIKLDSSSFAYDFDFRYNYFYNSRHLYQHNFVFDGVMAKTFRGFYAGSGIEFDFYRIPEELLSYPKYVFTLSPFLKKSSPQWNFKLGFKADIERNIEESAKPHFYPDLNFGFGIVPSYIYFFTSLTGHLEQNDPFKVIGENPFIIPDGSLFKIPNTSHQLEVSAGFKGNTGIDGNYVLSASYSMVDNMLFYTNIVHPDTIFRPYRGNLFAPLTDDVEVLNVHGAMTGRITDKLTFSTEANYYQYTLTRFEHAWNKPSWDLSAGLKYNLRDKILAGIELTALGKRTMVVNGENIDIVKPEDPALTIEMPAHVNLNLSAEYRYSKILSFWAKLDNVSYRRYYEWAYYPSQQFQFMLGFTYSL